MSGCGHCGARLEILAHQVGRRDTCPSCEQPLRSCRSCRHFDLQIAKQCREPFAEVPADKDAANFCEFFQIGEGGHSDRPQKDALLSAAEALFRK